MKKEVKLNINLVKEIDVKLEAARFLGLLTSACQAL